VRGMSRSYARASPICAGLHFQRVPDAARVHTNYLLLGRVEGDRGAFHKKLTATGFPCTPFYPHTLVCESAVP